MKILFFRFVIGFLALLFVCPRRMKNVERKQEMIFMLSGLCEICLYYLLENIALTYTMASNVGVIISITPFFTAVLSRLLLKSEGKLRVNFFIVSTFEYPVILTTRRTFFYRILFMVPAFFFLNFEIEMERFFDITYFLNILYLGWGRLWRLWGLSFLNAVERNTYGLWV